MVANATGTGPSWHAAQQRVALGGVRGGIRTWVSTVT